MLRHIPIFITYFLHTCLVLLAVLFLYNNAHARTPLENIDDMIRTSEQQNRILAESIENATVLIYCAQDARKVHQGTGFIVADGYVLTSAHVVASGGTLKGEISIMGKALPATQATVVAWLEDANTDFALLHFSSPLSKELPILPFNLHTRRTDRVRAWGFPKTVLSRKNASESPVSIEKTVNLPPVIYTEGEVSSFVHNGSGQSIVHTAAVAKGNSGGPLINAYGHVVGINIWIAVDANEGAYVSAALASADAVRFLRACDVEPRIAQSPHTMPTVQNSPPTKKQTQDIEGPISGYLFDTMNNNLLSSADLTGTTKTDFDLATNENADAQARLAHAYYYGENAPRNTQKGVYWMEKAAKKGHSTALANLGIILITSAEFKNVPLGLECLRKAIKTEPQYGLFLARYLYDGEALGIAPHLHEARAALQASVKAGNPKALALEARMILESDTHNDAYTRAQNLATQASQAHIALGNTVLAWLAFADDNMPQAVAYAQKAADKGDTEAMALLGMFYLNGMGVPTDTTKAFAYSKQAAYAGNALGAANLAQIYAFTEGFEKDLALAWAYSVMGARHEHISAIALRDSIEIQLSPEQRAAGDAYVAAWFAQWGLKQ